MSRRPLGTGARPAARGVTPAKAGVRPGFTMVEVVFAILMLSIGLLSLAGLALATSRMTVGGGRQTAATAAAQARFDSLASVPCALLAPAGPQTGTTNSTRGVKESWAVVDSVQIKKVFDTLWVTGRSQPIVFLSAIPCR